MAPGHRNHVRRREGITTRDTCRFISVFVWILEQQQAREVRSAGCRWWPRLRTFGHIPHDRVVHLEDPFGQWGLI
ncbi:hypothetical protein SBA6_200008 [Candidatus Sulfopaludibacter sp. SbA6]|nr:hypothetical protein SBA6_200008 [Candidatus Sulfopaludibacter sp. SbA6]